MISQKAKVAVLSGLVLILAASARGDTSAPGYNAGQLYNLGNAYARAGQPGLAVLTYERARLLAPTDDDLESNLRRVREAARVSAESRSKLEIVRMSPPAVEAVGFAGLLLGGLTAIALRRRYGQGRLIALGSVLGVSLICVAAGNALLVWPKLHSAVVIAHEAPVRAAPVPLGDALFVLPEAETVNITAEHEDFVLVQTPQGRTGWMARAAVALIVPRK